MAANRNGQNTIPVINTPLEDEPESNLPPTLTGEQIPSRSSTPRYPLTPTTPSPTRNGYSQRPSLSGLRTPSIRIRRANSSTNLSSPTEPSPQPPTNSRSSAFGRLVGRGRPRSASDPPVNLYPPSPSNALTPSTTRDPNLNLTPMPTVSEEPSSRQVNAIPIGKTGDSPQKLQRNAAAVNNQMGNDNAPVLAVGLHDDDTASIAGSAAPAMQSIDMDSNMVDVLDVIDPEISTLTTLTNMQNSLVIPNLGRWLSRRPVFLLTPSPADPESRPSEPSKSADESQDEGKDREPELTRTSTISSTMVEGHYAVLPRGKRLSGWSPGEKHELDDHVRHMLHSKRSKFKRAMKGFGQYIKKRKGPPRR